jgi:small subunit ribosomal protein S19
MAKINFKGKTEEEISNIDLQDFVKLVPSRQRRSISRGFTVAQKKLLKKIASAKAGRYTKTIKTHCRNMIILPQMLGLTIHLYNGKTFSPVEVTIERLGHYFGEFVDTRTKVKHNAPGIGATRSSAYQSVK